MESVGAMVESGWKMTGKSDANDGQHQSSEREQSIHDAGCGGYSTCDNDRQSADLSLRHVLSVYIPD